MQPGLNSARVRRRAVWPRVFVVGLVLWVLSVVVTALTQNLNLIPTIVLLGSFLVPATVVTWAFEHRESGTVTADTILVSFLVGGVLGVLGASVLEAFLLTPSAFLYLGVGLIEEGVKLAALAALAWRLRPKTMRDGIVLGATVGLGFSAFESAGYAFGALLTIHGLSLSSLVETELLRGLLTPVGHGLWTAILGGVLFATSRNDRFRLTWQLVLTYLGVSLLHALWDSIHGIAAFVTLVLTSTRTQRQLLELGYIPQPTEAQQHLMTILDWTGLAIVSVIGILWLLAGWRRGRQDAAGSRALTT